MKIHRRHFLVLPLLAAAGGPARALEGRQLVEVWKGPACGCCMDWIVHLRANGFDVRAHDSGNAGARQRLGMPINYGSCHTAQVAGYAVEGHVPAREIRRLLQERPQAIGLAVPAMPLGSPGMDGPAYRGQRHPYDVLLVQRGGSSRVFQAYR